MESVFKCQFDIQKTDNAQKMVFGWANVAIRATGEQIEDFQEDVIDIEELEKSAYVFVTDYGTAGEMHKRKNIGTLIESVVFTKEKAQLMGLSDGTMPEAWWIGFKITDDAVWGKVKDGTYSMFSIEGTAIREEII